MNNHVCVVCCEFSRRPTNGVITCTDICKLAGAAKPEEPSADLVALDEALTALAELDPRKSRVVELRFFGGLSVEETAEVLQVSPITVMREWNKAKAWLYRELSRGKADEA